MTTVTGITADSWSAMFSGFLETSDRRDDDLYQPIPHALNVLLDEPRSELFEPGRRILERADQELAFVDLQGEHADAVCHGIPETSFKVLVADEVGELQGEAIGDGKAGEKDGRHRALLRSSGVLTGSAVGCSDTTAAATE